MLGASGFIGRWLARWLDRAGAELGLLVRDPEAARRVAQQYAFSGTIVPVDLTNAEAAQQAIVDFRPSITFNAAGYGVDHSERDPQQGMLVNAQLVEHVATAAAQCIDNHWPGQHFVQLGSALEYGEANGNLHESTPPRPTTWYGQSKLFGTQHLQHICQQVAGFRALTARLFMVYGPGEHPARLFPTLIAAASSNEPLHLSAGRQEKDFTYVEDVAQACLRLGLAREGEGSVVNVATGRLMPVRQFVELAADQLGIARQRLRFGTVQVRPGEMRHQPVCLDRLRRLVGWTPSTDVRTGIEKTITFLTRHTTQRQPF